MAYELYAKPGFGRRLRKVTALTGLHHILGNLWTSIAGYGDHNGPAVPPAVPPSAAVTGENGQKVTVKLAGDFPLDKAYTANVSYAIDAGSVTPFVVAIAKGTTLAAAITKITTDTNWPAALTAVATADGFTADAGTGKVVKSFAIAFIAV